MKQYLIALALLLSGLPASAKEAFSYLYIQGDKQTPFYVKLEDAMQPRYGKNYCIIPQLASGPTHIEILFQQNAFPAEKFTVLMPESGSRGFLLVKKDEGFALYDLQQGFYLSPGNDDSDDHMPAAGTVAFTPSQLVDVAKETPNAAAQVAVTKEEPAEDAPVRKAAKPRKKPVRTHTSNGPAFIPDMELSQKGSATAGDNVEKTVKPASAAPTPAAIINSDCPSAISTIEFKKIFNEMSANSSDEDRLGYVLGKLDLCYESWQARALAQMLSGEAARFTLLKKIYPRITDQAAFSLLDDLFTSDTWKGEFARLVHH